MHLHIRIRILRIYVYIRIYRNIRIFLVYGPDSVQYMCTMYTVQRTMPIFFASGFIFGAPVSTMAQVAEL